jgi:hypothetical protein
MPLTPTANAPETAAQPIRAVVSGFILTRVVILLAAPPMSDVSAWYVLYARKFTVAVEQGTSLYAVHRLETEQRARQVHLQGQDVLAERILQAGAVEYPPPAVGVMILPLLFLGQPALHGDGSSFVGSYTVWFRRLMVVPDALAFVLLLALVRRLYPTEGAGGHARRLAVYVLGGLLLWPVLYDRLDVVMSVLVLGALLLLVVRVHYLWSFAVLALAINFKLVPVVLAPVWIIGSLPARPWGRDDRPVSLLALAGGLLSRAALLLLLTVALFLPFWLLEGPDTLGFLDYHRKRGIEIGSLHSSILMLMQLFGYETQVYAGFGGINITSELEPLLHALFLGLLTLLLLAGAGMLLRDYRRAPSQEETPEAAGTTFAQCYPGHCAAFALWLLAASVTVGKVLSPQYLIALVPLVALMPFGKQRNRCLTGIFFLACLLTTLLVPFLFWQHLAGVISLKEGLYQGPTVLGAAVLGARNLLLAGVTLLLAAWLSRPPALTHVPPAPGAVEATLPSRPWSQDGSRELSYPSI